MLTRTSSYIQPQIDKSLTLLHSGYQESPGYLMLDLYGSFDPEDGYFVEAVAVTGTMVDLSEMASEKLMIDLSTWCDLTLPSAEQMNEDAKNEAAIDRAESRKENA